MRATTRLADLAAAKDRIAVSDLVRLEFRIVPLRNADTTKSTLFDAFCVRPDVQVVPITNASFDRATLILLPINFTLLRLRGDFFFSAIQSRIHHVVVKDFF